MGESVKVYEAQAQFSALLSRVEVGEEIIISRGDTPVVCARSRSRRADRSLCRA